MLAIIPARGGSKGLPGKNMKELCGKTLLAHTIEQAFKSNVIDDVIVTTEDPYISDHARACGAAVVQRPDSLATDDSKAFDVYRHACSVLAGMHYITSSYVVLLPTAPLRLPEDIVGAVELFNARHYTDAVISVAEASKPSNWHCVMRYDGSLLTNDDNIDNRQSYAKEYIPNGSIYVFNRSFVDTHDTYHGLSTYGYIMPPERSIDIDTQLDFDICEMLLSRRVKDSVVSL